MEGFALTSRQRSRLVSRLRRAQDVRLYRRTLAVLEVGSGKPVAEVAQTLGVTRQSIYHWIESYAETGGPEALVDAPRLGRPRLWTQESDAVLEALLEASPEQCGYPGANWTVPWLQDQLEQNLGRYYSDDTVRRGLHGLGYVWKRSRYVLEPDPERGKKMRRILTRLGALGARSVLLAEDETDLLLFPPLQAGWSRRGQPRQVPISGRNARRVIFGAMNLKTGRCWWLSRTQRSGDDFRAFLEVLHWHYRGWHVVLLLDEDSSHTAGASQELAAKLSMELLWLPKRAPELNPLDELWGQAKDVVSANRQFATIDDHVQRFLQHLESLSRPQILQTAGVLSSDFWLRPVLSKDFCGVA